MKITLTRPEWDALAGIGEKRRNLRLQRGDNRPEFRDNGGTKLDRERLGSVAEGALAKLLGPDVYADWAENKSFSLDHKSIPCDVGKNLHVRATKLPHGGLIVHPYDPALGVFVLAVVDEATLTVTFLGWEFGRNAQRDSTWRDTGPGFGRRPAHVVPQGDLKPMDTLPKEAVR